MLNFTPHTRKMKKAVTIVEIAKLLKMSVSTVSKALNDHPAIGAITKERVKAKAKELNYIPNQAARFFQQKKSFQLGVIMPSLRDQFYVEAVSGMEAVARQNNYITLLCQSHEDPDRERDLVKTMLLQRVDGVIITVTKQTRDFDHIRQLEQVGIPVVYFVRVPDTDAIYSVSNNVFEAAKDATRFLIARGHTKLGHLMGPDNLVTSVERCEGFKAALAEAGIALQPGWIQSSDLSRSGTENAFGKMMHVPEPPTAVLAFKDHVALDALALGHPSVEFVGFGNSPSFRYMNYPLVASVEEHPYGLGEKAVDQLLKLMEAEAQDKIPSVERSTRNKCELVVYHK